MRRVAALVVVALAAAAAPSSAVVVDRRPAEFSSLSLAMGPGGGVLAWQRDSSIVVVSLDRDARPDGPVRTLRQPLLVGGPITAVDERGDAVVAWTAHDRSGYNDYVGWCCPSAHAAYVDAGGRVRTRAPVAIPGESREDLPVVAIDDGRAVVGWGTVDGLQISVATRRSPFSAPRRAVEGALNVQHVAFAGRGILRLVWTTLRTTADHELRGADTPIDDTLPGGPLLLPDGTGGIGYRAGTDGTQLATRGADAYVAPPDQPFGAPQRLPRDHDGRGFAYGVGGGRAVALFSPPRASSSVWMTTVTADGTSPPVRLARHARETDVGAVAVRTGEAAIAIGRENRDQTEFAALFVVERDGTARRTVLPDATSGPDLEYVGARLFAAWSGPSGMRVREVGR